jgi:hypothetical protein
VAHTMRLPHRGQRFSSTAGVPGMVTSRVAYAADVHSVQLAAGALDAFGAATRSVISAESATGSAAAGSAAAPLVVRLVLFVVLLAIAAALGAVGYLGWRGRLVKDGRLGVRSVAAMTDSDTFTLSNRVAGLPTLVAGVIAAFAGAAAFGLPSATGTVVAAVIGFVGAIVIALAGGVLGDRAAQAMLASKPTVPARCVGCACGGCEALTRG